MIYDLIVLAVFIGFILLGVYRGAAASLANILITFVSYIAAAALAKLIAATIYTSVIGPAIAGAVNDALSQAAASAADSVNASLPGWLTGALQLSGQDVDRLFSSAATAGLYDTAVSTVDAIARPIIESILTIFLTILLYIVISLILRKLVIKPLLHIFRLPIINGINKALGGLIGAVNAFLIVSMLGYLLKLLLPYIGSQTTILNESTIYNSFIFYWFYSGNIFSALISWI